MKQKLHWTFCYRLDLEKDCRDPQLHSELERLDSLRPNIYSEEHLRKRSEQLRREIEDGEFQMSEKILSPGRNEKMQRLKAQVKDWQAERDRVEAELDGIRRRDAEINSAQDKIREAMLFA